MTSTVIHGDWKDTIKSVHEIIEKSKRKKNTINFIRIMKINFNAGGWSLRNKIFFSFHFDNFI